MGTFTFNIDQVPGAPIDADSAKTFKITGPNTLTQAQAQAIFEKQQGQYQPCDHSGYSAPKNSEKL